jgi:hypothetical protein
MLEMHQSTFKPAKPDVEKPKKSTKLAKTSSATQPKQQNQPRNNPTSVFS